MLRLACVLLQIPKEVMVELQVSPLSDGGSQSPPTSGEGAQSCNAAAGPQVCRTRAQPAHEHTCLLLRK